MGRASGAPWVQPIESLALFKAAEAANDAAQKAKKKVRATEADAEYALWLRRLASDSEIQNYTGPFVEKEIKKGKQKTGGVFNVEASILQRQGSALKKAW